MSFLRHREIYRSDGLGFRESGARSGGLHAPTHRFDEFPAGYSLAGCAPAEPASASPAEQKFTMKAIPRPSFFQRMGKPCLAGCLTSGVHRGFPPGIKPGLVRREGDLGLLLRGNAFSQRFAPGDLAFVIFC